MNTNKVIIRPQQLTPEQQDYVRSHQGRSVVKLAKQLNVPIAHVRAFKWKIKYAPK